MMGHAAKATRPRSHEATKVGTALAALILVASANPVFAQSVELRVTTTTLEVGESADAQLICTNVDLQATPKLNAPEGIGLQIVSATPQVSQSTRIVNGRVSKTSRSTYQLRLTALREGTFRIGPMAVEADGKTYHTQPVDIEVRKPDTTTGGKGDRVIFVELEVSPQSLYVTQSYRATLTIGIRKIEIGGRIVDLQNLLGTAIDVSSSQLGNFPTTGWERANEVSLNDSAGRRHRYEVFRCAKQVRAEEVGEVQVGPIFVKANYPTDIQRSWPFGDLEVTSARKETARAEAIKVVIKGPPEEGRPADFTGAIGQYAMGVSAKPDRVDQGQPITLAVTIRGGPLEGVAPPNLAAQPELASRFEYTKDESIGDTEQGAKVFRRAIFPKLAGEQVIPALSWSFFDPQRETYVTLASDPIAIKVDPSSSESPDRIALSPGGKGEGGTTLTVLAGGISPNYVDAEAVLANQDFVFSRAHMAVLSVAPLACLAVTLTSRHQARLKSDVTWARRRKARQQALQRIRQALRDGEPMEQWARLSDALTGYLADRFGLPPGTLTPREARVALAVAGTNGSMADDVSRFLETCDAARYARGAAGSLSPAQAAADLRRWIDQIERSTR